MTEPDVKMVREQLENSHRMGLFDLPDCPALEDEVLTYPDRCNCGVKDALERLSRISSRLEELEARLAFERKTNRLQAQEAEKATAYHYRTEDIIAENERLRVALEEIATKSEHEARFLGMDDGGTYRWEFGCAVVARAALARAALEGSE